MDATIILSAVLLLLGMLVGVVGMFMLLVAAFKDSIAWGLAVLFLPGANLIFTIFRWPLAKPGFILQLCSAALFTAGVVPIWPKITEQLRAPGKTPFAQFVKPSDASAPAATTGTTAGTAASPAPPAGVTTAPPATAADPAAGLDPALVARIAANRQRFARLQIWYVQLERQRQALPARDATALRAFNEERQKYQAELQAAKAEAAEIANTPR